MVNITSILIIITPVMPVSQLMDTYVWRVVAVKRGKKITLISDNTHRGFLAQHEEA